MKEEKIDQQETKATRVKHSSLGQLHIYLKNIATSYNYSIFYWIPLENFTQKKNASLKLLYFPYSHNN